MTPALDIATETDCGRVRTQNEDCLAAFPEAGVALLADGMGGHNAGEVASEMAVRLTADSLRHGPSGARALDRDSAERLLAAAIEQANAEIFRAGESQSAYLGMGTTIVAALWHDHAVTIAHVGDSRAYRLRAGEFQALTRDHTVVQEQVERGLLTPAQAHSSSGRHLLTRAVGTEPAVVVDVETHAILKDDVYVLCSDGVHDMLGDQGIRDVLLRNADSVSGAARALIEQANAAGGLDNASAIVARVVSTRGDGGA